MALKNLGKNWQNKETETNLMLRFGKNYEYFCGDSSDLFSWKKKGIVKFTKYN